MASKALKTSDNYKMQNILGCGVQGYVVKCIKRDTNETVAVKVLKQRLSKSSKIREVVIMKKLRCLDPDKANIIRCHEWFHSLDRICIVFEFLDMSIHDYMCQRKWVPLPLNNIKIIIRDLATALKAVKGVGLIHTDLKPDNIMLVDHQKQPFRVKLIDFGLTLHTSEVKPGMKVQPLWYRSPEVILGMPFTEAVDVWSLGLLMAEILLGFPLFPGRQEYDVLRLIRDVLGEPPKILLSGGTKTHWYYHTGQKLLFKRWMFKTPKEFYRERGIEPRETRLCQVSSLNDLKKSGLHKESSAEAADRSACVELMKEMLYMDPRKRITPTKILAHLFIRRIYVNPSNISHPQNIQNKMTNCPKAKDERDLILETVSEGDTFYDNNLKLESITDAVRRCPAVDCDVVSVPLLPPNGHVEAPDCFLIQASNDKKTLHTSEVGDSKKKKEKKKKKKVVRGFCSIWKDNIFSCIKLPEGL